MPNSDNSVYPGLVREIHNEFSQAPYRIIQKTITDLRKLKDKSALQEKIKKGIRLRKIGFVQAEDSDYYHKQLEELKKEELSKKDFLKQIWYYKTTYINYKFITEEEVETICKKYNLVCGSIPFYKGFVPDKNLKDIEIFNSIFKEKDAKKGKTLSERYDCDLLRKNELLDLYRQIERGSSNSNWIEDGNVPMKICAPQKDMDMTYVELEKEYNLKHSHIPDPVVLQPVAYGYLIVTAWGNEASDAIVVNPISN